MTAASLASTIAQELGLYDRTLWPTVIAKHVAPLTQKIGELERAVVERDVSIVLLEKGFLALTKERDGLRKAMKRAEQLAGIAYDWNLGTDGKVEKVIASLMQSQELSRERVIEQAIGLYQLKVHEAKNGPLPSMLPPAQTAEGGERPDAEKFIREFDLGVYKLSAEDEKLIEDNWPKLEKRIKAILSSRSQPPPPPVLLSKCCGATTEIRLFAKGTKSFRKCHACGQPCDVKEEGKV